MEQIGISGTTLTFRGKSLVISGTEKIDNDSFFIHTDKGSFRFDIPNTILNGGAMASINDISALIPFSNYKVPKWTAMIEALEKNAAINQKLFLQASGPGYARLMFILGRGEKGDSAYWEDELQKLLSDKHPTSQRRLIFHNSGVGNGNWTNDEREQINTYFTNHDFNITISL